MTPSMRTSLFSFASQPNSTTQPRNPDTFAALKGFYVAFEEQDQMRAEAWLRHLELIEYFQRLNTGCVSGSDSRERGGK